MIFSAQLVYIFPGFGLQHTLEFFFAIVVFSAVLQLTACHLGDYLLPVDVQGLQEELGLNLGGRVIIDLLIKIDHLESLLYKVDLILLLDLLYVPLFDALLHPSLHLLLLFLTHASRLLGLLDYLLYLLL